MLGRDPFDIEAIVGGMIRDQYQGGSTVMTAISGVEIALWDLIGKACGQPVYRLLGGRCHATLAGLCQRLVRRGAHAGRLCRAGARGRRPRLSRAEVRPVRHGLEGARRGAGRGGRRRSSRRSARPSARRRADDRVPRPALRRGGHRDDPRGWSGSSRPGARSRSRRRASTCWPRSSGRPAARSRRASGCTPRPISIASTALRAVRRRADGPGPLRRHPRRQEDRRDGRRRT